MCINIIFFIGRTRQKCANTKSFTVCRSDWAAAIIVLYRKNCIQSIQCCI